MFDKKTTIIYRHYAVNASFQSMHGILILLKLLVALQEMATSTDGADDVVKDYIDPFDYAALVDIKDELLIGDTALAIDHIDEDIDKFEELKKKIHYLESAMAQHASKHIVDGDDVEDADLMLKEMDTHVLGVFKEHLVDLKEHMMQPHPPFTNETMQQIGSLVNTAELFLNMSKLRVNQVRIFFKVLFDTSSLIQLFLCESCYSR